MTVYIKANLFGIRFLAMSVISVNKCSVNVCFIKILLTFSICFIDSTDIGFVLSHGRLNTITFKSPDS